jgi:DNA-binding response OmpR family regulator
LIDSPGQAVLNRRQSLAPALSRAFGNVMPGSSLGGRSILVVEDEPLIALDIVQAFEKAGAVVLAARSLADAIRFVEHDGLSAAILDFGLGDDDASALCLRLKERRIPFILHSGYSHHGPACRNGIVIPKPASPATLIETVVGLLQYPGDRINAQGSHFPRRIAPAARSEDPQ